MAKRIALFRSVLFWSIISAAFIGPGTVTTAAKAGSAFGFQLAWALVFSILATIFLQEAAARLTIASNKNLGQIIALRNARYGRRWQIGLFLAVAFGCAAYQAGNLLGAVAGLLLLQPEQKSLLLLVLGGFSFFLLWRGSYIFIARALGLMVAAMGVLFFWVAIQFLNGAGTPVQLAQGMPPGSGVLVIGLIGTTIVPYNLFLASGISRGQSIREMRWGITLAVLVGGLISLVILVVGSRQEGVFSFAGLSAILAAELGDWSRYAFAFGLFAAGLSSSVTAPLAAAVTGRSLLGEQSTGWGNSGKWFRTVWMLVLGIGLGFALLDVKPVPAIIGAQAINGLLLPLVAVFLLFSANDQALLGKEYSNRPGSNLALLLIVGVCIFLGLYNLARAALQLFNLEMVTLLPYLFGLTILLIARVGMQLRRMAER